VLVGLAQAAVLLIVFVLVDANRVGVAALGLSVTNWGVEKGFVISYVLGLVEAAVYLMLLVVVVLVEKNWVRMTALGLYVTNWGVEKGLVEQDVLVDSAVDYAAVQHLMILNKMVVVLSKDNDLCSVVANWGVDKGLMEQDVAAATSVVSNVVLVVVHLLATSHLAAAQIVYLAPLPLMPNQREIYDEQ
jgi:hypothetical protein